ncbi:MAG: hypothetical protein WCI77_04590 [Candidatus Omnitrophota bacterium]
MRYKIYLTRLLRLAVFVLPVILAVYHCDPAAQAYARSQEHPSKLLDTQPAALAALINSAQWKQIQIFWSKLNACRSRPDRCTMGEYFAVLDAKKSAQLYKELEQIITGLERLEKDRKISSSTKEILQNVLRDRLDYFSGVKPEDVLSQEIPLYVTRRLHIIDLERNIDALQKLHQTKKNISKVQKLLGAVQTRVNMLIAFYRLPQGMCLNASDERMVRALITDLVKNS